jgi:hypothetical protein
MSEAELLDTTDARVWADEFNKRAINLGYPKMDDGWLIAWFANAMFAQEMATRRKLNIGPLPS